MNEGAGSEGGFSTDVWLAEMTTRWEVSGAPNTRFSGFEHVSETGSTNKDLLDAGRAGEAEGRVLITDHQTSGRGRQGRTWVEQPETSLLMSVLLRPDPSWAPLLPLAFGSAVVAAVESVVPNDSGLGIGLKWPNDVLVQTSAGERKLAGILAEAIMVDQELVVVVGCGMNLRRSEDIPAEVSAKAVALSALAGVEVDRFELALMWYSQS